ncbi:hypothetical protein PMKS-001753 [Pichia membranifaciens]|uniref:GP-PDE domain-containing protein n=1 Tax=Pichia membranifaciens TaxID=4926 RepID=A0A1Q2YFX1_9ASCO|nr:hypothetical protein PMKS-001753 [Pichia membranifaciens]
MCAFQAAVDAGCDVIELDLHTSIDGFVVVTHDVNTLRVFGGEFQISKTKYVGVLDQLRTIAKPRSPMPLLEEVLDWCVKVNEEVKHTGREIKLMLDVKSDNEPTLLMKKLWAECQKDRLKSGDSNEMIKYWKKKLILGLWDSKFYDPAVSNNFTIVNITFDILKAQRFYKEIKEKDKDARLHAISMINLILYKAQDKDDMLRWAEEENIKLWFWTVNENADLQNIITICSLPSGNSLLEGIVTDDPIKVLDQSTLVKTPRWRYNLKWWLKSKIYSFFLLLSRGGYNLGPFVNCLKRIGFI